MDQAGEPGTSPICPSARGYSVYHRDPCRKGTGRVNWLRAPYRNPAAVDDAGAKRRGTECRGAVKFAGHQGLVQQLASSSNGHATRCPPPHGRDDGSSRDSDSHRRWPGQSFWRPFWWPFRSGRWGQQATQQMMDGGPVHRGAQIGTMLHRLNTANAGWSDTMIKRLTSDLRSGVQTVRIILEPHHLGR